MDPRIGIIALVPEPWHDFPRTARHHMLAHLALRCQVVWVDPARHWYELLSFGPGTSPHREQVRLPAKMQVLDADAGGMKVYSPDWLGRALERRRLARARRMLQQRGADKIVLYLWRPEFARALNLVEHDLSCYHIDDEYSFSPQDKGLDPSEAELIRKVGQVFIHSHALMEKKGSLNPNTLRVPNGVDFAAFSTPCGEPEDLATIPHPRAGYVGVIKRHLDLDLMLHVADLRPEMSFVFVGPVLSIGDQQRALEVLRRRPNCHFLGARRTEDLPGYMQHLDVGMLCYRIDGYTQYIYPLKLHEYLAAGLPVVASPIRALHEFEAVVDLPRSPERWSAALAAAASKQRTDSVLIAERRAIARQFDWDRLADTVVSTMAARLATSPTATTALLSAAA